MARRLFNDADGVATPRIGARRRIQQPSRATAFGLLLLAGCAVPVPPSGGPPDDRPPEVVSSDPADGAVSVRPDRVRVQFDEFVNGRTAAGAVSVTPPPNQPPEIRTGGKTVDVVFREPLRDNTTYIVTIDKGLQDAHGVALGAPVRVAFATGDRINRGKIHGRVLRSEDGQSDEGVDIFAYRTTLAGPPQNLPSGDELPDYRTQTDGSGQFEFDYLQEGAYFVLGVRDTNRNRIPDQGEALAWPPIPVVDADSTGGARGLWLSAVVDTTGPVARRAIALSSSRTEIVFDGPVRFSRRDPGDWTISDSSGRRYPVSDVYQRHDDLWRVILVSGALGSGSLTVAAGPVIADSANNVVGVPALSFNPTARPDTLHARFLGFRLDTLGTAVLRPQSQPELLFAAPPDSSLLRRWVVVADTSGRDLPWSRVSQDGTSLTISVEAADLFRIEVDLQSFGGPDSTASVTLSRASAADLGELGGVVRGNTHRVVVQSFLDDRMLEVAQADSTGVFVLRDIPGGETRRLVLFEDRNENGVWDFGGLNPYVQPERRGWLGQTPPARARWETVLPDTLHLIDFIPPPDSLSSPDSTSQQGP